MNHPVQGRWKSRDRAGGGAAGGCVMDGNVTNQPAGNKQIKLAPMAWPGRFGGF